MKLTFVFLSFFVTMPLISQWRVLVPNLISPSTNNDLSGGTQFKFTGGGIFYAGSKIWVAPHVDVVDGVLAKVYRSTDIGLTWTTFLPTANNSTINSISFFDEQIGIISSNSGVLYLTNDGGNTWIQKGGLIGTKVIVLTPTVFISSAYTPSLTTDAGTTWNPYFPYSIEGAIFPICKDNLGSVYFTGDNTSYVTHDSGASWVKRNVTVDPDSYSIAAHRSCYDTIIYVANEDSYGKAGASSRSNGHSDIYVSRDGGISFRSVYTDSYSLTGGGPTGTIKAAKHGVAYCATFSGVIRTTDYGDTWHSIGGPGGRFDVHTFDLINDSTLIALDTAGNIWITENSGGFPIPRPTLHHPLTTSFSLTGIKSCDSEKGVLSLKHIFCAPLTVTDISYDKNLNMHYRISLPALPDTLLDQEQITIPISFDPHTEVGSFPGSITIRGYYIDDGDTMRIDTSIYFSSTSIPVAPKLIKSANFLDIGSISLCGVARDTIVTLTNTGCDTLSITQGPGVLSPEFQMLSILSLPIKLPPDSSITIRFRFFPSGVGSFGCNPRFRAEQQGLTQDIEFELTGRGTEGDGEFAYEPKQFDLKTLSICGRDSASGYITNTGCDTLLLSDATLFASSDYTLSSLPAREIIPDDTIRYTVYLNPQQKGTRTGYVVFTTSNRSGARKDSVAITATVTDGTRILASSPNSLDFGTTTLCQERDSLVTLRNTGCDTLKVTGVGVQGSGFRVAGGVVPIIIPPGGSVEIPINAIVDTSQGSISTGTITFTSDADNQIAPITLSRGYTYPKNYSFHLGMPTASGTADEIVRLAIVGEQGLGSAGSNVSRLDFDLALNEDLLEYITYEGSNQVIKNGNHITITNSNELTSTNDTLAILRYRVFLTKDSATDITVSNISLNDGDTSRCAPQITAATQAGYSYRYECGDRHIQSFLRTGKASLEITSIRPNPAKNHISIEVHSVRTQDVVVEIFDALGKRQSQFTSTLSEGNNVVTSSLSEVPSGTYIVSITSGMETTSARFSVNN